MFSCLIHVNIPIQVLLPTPIIFALIEALIIYNISNRRHTARRKAYFFITISTYDIKGDFHLQDIDEESVHLIGTRAGSTETEVLGSPHHQDVFAKTTPHGAHSAPKSTQQASSLM
jgi:hypothetical protein